MRKIMCLFISFVLVISICFGSVFAEEIIFDVSEGAEETGETVFEEPANWDEEENVTEDSFVIEEEFVSEDSSFAEDEMILLEDVQNEEVVSSEDASASYEDGDLLIDDSVLSEDEVISWETITDDPSFENVVASGTCGPNLTWKLTGEEGNMTLTISGSGEMDNYVFYEGDVNTPWFRYRSSIINIILSEEITSIGENAFDSCTKLTSIIIPNKVLNIGREAFYSCNSLTSITIPQSVTSIGLYAFGHCGGLSDINVSKNNIAYASNEGVLFDKNYTKLICCPEGKSGKYIIPNSVNSIAIGAFSSCTALTDIVIPNSVTDIETVAFSNCTGFTSINIPESVMNIKYGVFYYNSNLISITIPKSVTYIDDDAFSGCTKLVIYGEKGSYAEKYAKENDIPFKSLSAALISKIALDKAAYNIFAGDTATIKASVSPSDAKDKTLNYKCDNTNIAKVSKSGKITAVAVGTATITVSANDGSGVKASCKVNVYNKPTAKLNITKKTIYTKGEPHQFILTPTVNNGELVSVTYSSSAPKIAYVAKSGKVTGKGAGKATLTATVKMKNECGTVTKKLTCKVTVKKPTLTVSPTSVSLEKGKSKTLTVKTTPSVTVSFSSSNKKVATVSSKGKVTAKKKGSCKITVECYGIKKTVKVTVTE